MPPVCSTMMTCTCWMVFPWSWDMKNNSRVHNEGRPHVKLKLLCPPLLKLRYSPPSPILITPYIFDDYLKLWNPWILTTQKDRTGQQYKGEIERQFSKVICKLTSPFINGEYNVRKLHDYWLKSAICAVTVKLNFLLLSLGFPFSPLCSYRKRLNRNKTNLVLTDPLRSFCIENKGGKVRKVRLYIWRIKGEKGGLCRKEECKTFPSFFNPLDQYCTLTLNLGRCLLPS